MNILQKYYAQGVAIATAIVGQVVAYVPAWRPEASHIISAGGFVVAAALLVHDGLKDHVVHTVEGEAVRDAKLDESKVREVVHNELVKLWAATPTREAAQQAQRQAAPQAQPAGPTSPLA